MSIEERPTTPIRLSGNWRLLTLLLAGVLCLSLACSPAPTYYDGGPPGRDPTSLELFLLFALLLGVPAVWYILRGMKEDAKSREEVEELRRRGIAMTLEEMMEKRREQKREEERDAEWSANCKERAEREKGENQTDEAGSVGKPASGPQDGGDFSI